MLGKDHSHFGGVRLLNVLERETSLVLQTRALVLHVDRQRDDVIGFYKFTQRITFHGSVK